MVSMAGFFASRPTIDGIAQHLVLKPEGPHQPRAAVISLLEPDGTLTARGSFGLSPQVMTRLQSQSLWENAPMIDAVRMGTPLIFPTSSTLLRHYPMLKADGLLDQPTAAWPLLAGDHRIGAMQLIFAGPVDEPILRQEFDGIAALLALYVAISSHDLAAPIGAQIQNSPLPWLNRPKEETLTKRQLEILEWMSQNLTNAQIAQRVGYSESTVRQETVVIYRVLGAEGRRHAVRIARSRGLLGVSLV